VLQQQAVHCNAGIWGRRDLRRRRPAGFGGATPGAAALLTTFSEKYVCLGTLFSLKTRIKWLKMWVDAPPRPASRGAPLTPLLCHRGLLSPALEGYKGVEAKPHRPANFTIFSK